MTSAASTRGGFPASAHGAFAPRARAASPATAPAWAGAVVTLALGLLVVAVPVLVFQASFVLSVAICAVAWALVANFAPGMLPAHLALVFVFQNVFVSLVAGELSGQRDFTLIRAYSFVATVVAWGVVVAAVLPTPALRLPSARGPLLASSIAIAAIFAYAGLGFAAGAGEGAVIYLRNALTPFLVFQIAFLVALAGPLQPTRTLTLICALAVGYGYWEAIGHESLFALVNGYDYVGLAFADVLNSGALVEEMRETGRVIRDTRDMMMVNLFNSTFFPDIRLYRLLGPNFHAISYAYAVAILALVLFAAGRRIVPLLALPVLVLVGSKGAMILFVLCLIGLAAWRLLPPGLVLAGYLGVLGLYAGVAFVVGLSVGDYHVIGFLGGVDGFVANPIGRGLGIGGNLSGDMTRIDWSRAQSLGRTEGAFESAVGVLLYQMGIGALVVLTATVHLALHAWRAAAHRRDPALALAALMILTILVNGVFQEEALFSPLAFGLVLLVAGLAMGRAVRPVEPSRRAAHSARKVAP
ncbi:hypothetical protein [Salinarimonas ramus]|uniref:Uncharacterized protein n=1 Tax=Salinarimonas ramus TaxID=690164 RepID=A0A917Q7D5_9HYPH|nr:hypothetical protein [Salinarimonas ramus]GGK34081.1 hypothetical protein GCM10011322_20970 [Salinarimonas ramus]